MAHDSVKVKSFNLADIAELCNYGNCIHIPTIRKPNQIFSFIKILDKCGLNADELISCKDEGLFVVLNETTLAKIPTPCLQQLIQHNFFDFAKCEEEPDWQITDGTDMQNLSPEEKQWKITSITFCLHIESKQEE